MSGHDENVVRPNFQQPQLVRGLSKSSLEGRRCSHAQTVVDLNAREVECEVCGAPLDPIQVLDRLARDGTNLRWAREELKRVKERVEELKAEEKRVKARLRRARRGTGSDG